MEGSTLPLWNREPVMAAVVVLVVLVKMAVLEIQLDQLVMVELVFSFRQHLEILLQQ